MAYGHGGKRQGAGRPRKSRHERALDGNANHRGRVLAHPNAQAAPPAPPPKKPVVDVDEAEAPNELTLEERQVWMRLAPKVMVNGTLTPDTEFAFTLLCRNVALERRYASSVKDAGGSSHRGLITIIDRELLRFKLAPCGDVAEEPAAPKVDPMMEKYVGNGRRTP